MKTIRISCGPLPKLPSDKAERLTAKQRDALVAFAEKHAPQLVDKVRRAEFVQKRNEEWLMLLDADKNSLGIDVHVDLWKQLFG